MAQLPAGTVTFLFTDVEGSTRLLHELGAERYAEALAEHRSAIRAACAAHDGVEVDTQGDAFFLAFASGPGAVGAARDLTAALAGGPISVRVGLHTGTPHVTEEGYVGEDVHLAARVAASAHGGQVVLTDATRTLLDGVELLELGEHRLKDVGEPVPIFQLGAEAFPPLKTISNTNLPRPASSFVGRGRELEEVIGRVRSGARLLTLTGPGGTGKTRLAVEAASELVSEFKAGVFWVGLATVRDPGLVTETVARTLGAKDGLAEHVGERELLLVLDNLEQVVDAAPRLADLLEACPNLRLLVTSRELLRVRGEVEYPVPPLEASEAVELFCKRAELEPSEEVRELCRRLDSLPLALELAAARTGALTPAQILERLSQRLDLLKGGRDADPRQQTLRATIAWSHELLTPDEQQLFRRLAVFAGGCTLEAAEQVAQADLDTLQSLVEKSLLRFADGRYRLLETVREFAAERLEEDPDAGELRRRHAGHSLALAEEAGAGLAEDWSGSLERLELEHDNFRAALDWLERSGEARQLQLLAAALFDLWYRRGHAREARLRLEAALAADGTPSAARLAVLGAAAWIELQLGDAQTARERAEQAASLATRLGDVEHFANASMALGVAAVEQGDFERARDVLEDALDRTRRLGDELASLSAGRLLGLAYFELGDLERSRALHAENLRLARAGANARAEAAALAALATIDSVRRRPLGEIVALLTESTRIAQELGLPYELAVDLSRLAFALAQHGRWGASSRLLGASAAAFEQLGAPPMAWLERQNEETRAAGYAGLGDEAFAAGYDEGLELTPAEAVEVALAAAADAG